MKNKNFLLLSIFFILLSGFVGADVFFDSYNTPIYADSVYACDNSYRGAQSFYINGTGSYNIINITISLGYLGASVNKDCNFAFYGNGVNKPNITQYGDISNNNLFLLNNDVDDYIISFTNVELEYNTMYWLVSTGNAGANGRWARSNTAINGNGYYSTNGGTSYVSGGKDNTIIMRGNNLSSNSPPILNIETPDNNTHLNRLDLGFNVSDVDGDLINCSLFFNDVLNYTFTDINTTSNPNQYINISSFDNETYRVLISCDDSFNVVNDTLDFIFDGINPIWNINSIETDNSSVINLYNTSYLFFNDTLIDSYIFGYNVTSYYPNGSMFFTNESINLSTNSFNYIRNVSLPNITGIYTINYYGEDDHTAKEIPIYNNSKDLTTGELLFDTDKNNHITIKLKDATSQLIDISTSKLIDRYTFDYYFSPNEIINTYTFKISSSYPLYYRENLYPYPVFVTGKNWIDFNLDTYQEVSYNVKNTKNGYEIDVITREVNLNFKSLGGLNFVNETYIYELIYIDTTPIISNNTYLNITELTNEVKQINVGIKMTGLIILYAIFLILSLLFKRGSWLIISASFGFFLFINSDYENIIKIVGMMINVMFLFFGIVLIKQEK